MKRYISIFLFFFSFLIACQKESDTSITTNKNIVFFDGLIFNAHEFFDPYQYFSTTDTFFKRPMKLSEIDSVHLANVDIVYIFDYNYTQPGFMDPSTASQHWYWDGDIYYFPWLSKSARTIFYITKLDKAAFDAAKENSALIDTYFKDPDFTEAHHGVFPSGSCIGGRTTYLDNTLKKGSIFGFKTVNTGKRGLLYIRTDQENGWPEPITSFRTKVDIIKEQ